MYICNFKEIYFTYYEWYYAMKVFLLCTAYYNCIKILYHFLWQKKHQIKKLKSVNAMVRLHDRSLHFCNFRDMFIVLVFLSIIFFFTRDVKLKMLLDMWNHSENKFWIKVNFGWCVCNSMHLILPLQPPVVLRYSTWTRCVWRISPISGPNKQ